VAAGQGQPDLGAPTTLAVVRHGVTPMTRQRLYSGAGGADPDLAELGRAQAQAVAGALAATAGAQGPWDAVIASPTARTRQTAAAVADRLGLPVQVDDGWLEQAFGAWDGLSAAQVADRWPDEHRAWTGSTSTAPPGGESLEALDERIEAARARTVDQQRGRRVVLVAHAGPVKVLVTRALGAPLSAAWVLESSPASVTVLRWWSDGGVAVVSFNETGHLHAAGLPLR
jgi:broad specificity phosphatase PhoE